MAARDWKMVVVALGALTVGLVLGGNNRFERAQAATQGQSGGVIALIGDEASQRAPIVLVDVPDQSVIVYEYNYLNDEIELTSVRSFEYDKLLKEWQTGGPTVEEVREYVTQARER